MNTAARTTETKSPHWYHQTGEPCHTVLAKNGNPRPTTLADARKLNLLPSVTTILDAVLRKPGLESWKTEQACLAVLTAPRLASEDLDAFVARVLGQEGQQHQEAQLARQRGTLIHDALENLFQGQAVAAEILPLVQPAFQAISAYGQRVTTEKVLVGDGYAGRTDLILEAPGAWWLFDYKTTRKLPDPNKGGAWTEHLLQCSAYAQALRTLLDLQTAGLPEPLAKAYWKPIRTANAYLSTLDPGQFVICEHSPLWTDAFTGGFAPLLKYWQWSNNYPLADR